MKKVIILDRDGTINVDTGYVYKKEDWQFTSGAPEALKKLQDAGYALVVATGQSGIGRGMYTEAHMHALHAHMQTLLREYGVVISAIAFCPHTPEEHCVCRKPNTGMFDSLEKQIGLIDIVQSWVIGDKPDDVRFGQAKSLKTILLTSKYWNEQSLEETQAVPTFVTGSLAAAADIILDK